jgi:hypothetical protein
VERHWSSTPLRGIVDLPGQIAVLLRKLEKH